MAATVADQAQAVLDYEQWREERAGKYVDTSAAGYVEYLETREALSRLDRVGRLAWQPVENEGLAEAAAILNDIREVLTP